MAKRPPSARKSAAKWSSSEDDAPRQLTPPGDRIPPPGPHREDILPLVSVGSVAFEKICRDILQAGFPSVVRKSLKRRSGQEQFGVDVEGFDASHDPFVVVSCKCYADVKGRYLLPWVKEFSKHLDGHWKDKKVKHFVLAVTHPGNDDALNDAARAVSEHLQQFGIEFHLWDALLITHYLRNDAYLIDQYFNRYWSDAVSARQQPGTPPVVQQGAPDTSMAGTTAIVLELSKTVADVVRQRDSAISARIEQARQAFRAGRVSELQGYLDQLQADDALWSTLDSALKAKALRARAVIEIARSNDKEAGRLLAEAKSLAPPPDRTAEALLVRAEAGPTAALATLTDHSGPKEIELKASLLLEVGETAEVLKLLDGVPSEQISAEQLRLRAIAECILGKRAQAVRTCELAAKRDPLSAVVQLTLAILHTMAALSERAQPVFDAIPNPINPALAKDTADARKNLRAASDIFTRLIDSTEEPFRHHAEVWKLAVLLLHPETRRDARSFSRVLLARPQIDPLVVAWGLSFGLHVQAGKMRKLLEDRLKQGSGTPSHVIVAALIAARGNKPERGLAVIERYAPRFPEAESLFRSWRNQFGDPSAQDASPYPAAMRAAVRNSEYGALLALLQRPETPADTIMSSAELFAGRSAWSEVDALRPKLLALETPKAVELAARAAVEVGKPTDTVQILETHADVFYESRLTPGMIYLRAHANDALGHKGKALADLESLAEEIDDPSVGMRLLQAQMSIGNVPAVETLARKHLLSGSTDPRNLIVAARFLKSAAPSTAQVLVQRAGSDPALPPELVPHVFSLAAETGLTDLQNRMMSAMVNADETASSRFLTRTSVDEFIAHMSSRAQALRAVFGDWLSGKAPFHIITESSPQMFAALFLAEPNDRINAVGDRFPMLIRSIPVARARNADQLTGERPCIRIDISALLLIQRLGITDIVDSAFRIRVPSSLPAALIELESALRITPAENLEACRKILAGGHKGLLTPESAPSDAVPVELSDHAGKANVDVLAAALRQAVRHGQLSQRDFDTALASLQLKIEEAGAEQPPVPAFSLSPFSVLQLSLASVLDAICQTIPTYFLQPALKELRRQTDQAERGNRYCAQVTALRTMVATRLHDGQWTTLPHRPLLVDRQDKNVSAHVRCLMEIIAGLQDSPEPIWVEDRYVSRAHLDKTVDLLDVLNALRERGAIGSVQKESLAGTLRDIGYAWIPSDITEITQKVLSAPVVDGVLVEDPDLARLRAWYAEEVLRLRHLDPTPTIGPDGHIQGEMRQILEVTAVAREVLRQLWAAAGVSNEDKTIRSAWIWFCLRFEQVEFLPFPQPTPEGRANVVALNLSHIAELPFMSHIAGAPMAADVTRAFMDWFTTATARASLTDAAVIDRMLQIISHTLSAALNLPQGADLSDDEKEAMAGHYRRACIRYLALLPDDWSNGVLAKNNLAEKLGLKTTVTVGLRPGLDIDIAELSSAIQTAESRQGSAELSTADGRQVTLSFARGPHSDVAATILDGDIRVPLEPLTIGIAHPDAAFRRSYLPTLPFVDLTDADRAATFSQIADLDDPAARASRLRTVMLESLAWRMQQIQTALRAGRPLSIELLEVPSPKVIAAHLRINFPTGSENDVAEEAVAGLSAQSDPIALVHRIAGLPSRLPAGFLKDLGTAVILERRQGQGPTGTPATPLFGLTLVQAVSSAEGVPDGMLQTQVGSALDAIAQIGPLFCALVRYASRVAETRTEWTDLPDKVYTILLWAYADFVTGSFVTAGADPNPAAGFIDGFGQRALAQVLTPAPRSPWVDRLVRQIDERAFRANIVAGLMEAVDIRTLAPEIIDRMKRISGLPFDTNGWMPVFEVAFPLPEAPPWLRMPDDPVRTFVNAGWLRAEHPIDTRQSSTLVQDLIAGGEAANSGRLAAATVLSHAPIERLDPALLPRILAFLETLQEAGRLEDPLILNTLMLKARILGHLEDEELLLATLARYAARAGERWPATRTGYTQADLVAPDEAVFNALTVAAFHFAKASTGTLEQKLTKFATGVRTVAVNWPATLKGAIGLLDRASTLTTVEAAGSIWKVLWELRSTR